MEFIGRLSNDIGGIAMTVDSDYGYFIEARLLCWTRHGPTPE